MRIGNYIVSDHPIRPVVYESVFGGWIVEDETQSWLVFDMPSDLSDQLMLFMEILDGTRSLPDQNTAE